jgi:hypothetical protein
MLDGVGADRAVLSDSFEAEQSVVGVPADRPEAGQIAEAATNAEVVSVVESSLSAKCAFELKILLDLVRL